MSQGILIPTLPIYAQSFEVSFGLIGLVVGAASIGTVAGDLPAGVLLGRFGRKPVMLAGACAVALVTASLGLAPWFGLLVVLRLAAGLGAALWSISRMAYIADVVPIPDRGRAISAFGGINRIGTFLGPTIGGIVGVTLGLQAAFFVAGGIDALAVVITALWVIEPPSRSGGLRRTLRWHHVGALILRYRRDFATAGAAQVFAQMIRQGRQVIVPLYGATILGLDVAAVGTIVSISSAIDMSLFIPAGLIMDRKGRKFTSVPSFLIMSVGMALLPLASSYAGLLAATAILGLGNGLGSGAMMTLGTDLAPRESTGEFLGVWRLIGDGGGSAGPLVVGGLADLLGLKFAAVALVGVGLVAAGTLTFFVRETLVRRRPHAAEALR